MKIFRHIWIVVILLIGFMNRSESALRPWEVYHPEEFSEHDRALVQSLFTEGMEERDRGLIADTFKKLTPEHRASIVESTLQLRAPNMDNGKISHLMGQISYFTNLENRSLTVDLVLKLIPVVGHKEKPWEHIHLLKKLETMDEKKDFVDFICSCSLFASNLTEQEEVNNCFSLMTALQESPDNAQRDNLVKWAAEICEPSAPANEKIKKQAKVIRSLAPISNNEDRDKFVVSVVKTGLLSLYEADKDTVLSALRTVSAEDERSKILEFLSNLGFISREINVHSFYTLFRDFADLSLVDRQRRWDLILRSNILTPTMTLPECVQLVNGVNHSMWSAKECGENAEEFNQRLMSIAASFMTPETTSDDRGQILFLLKYKESPWEQKELLVSYASQLCTVNMTSHDRLAILNALAVDVDGFLHPSVLQYRFEFASGYLQEATLQGMINEDNIFMWIHAFLEEARRVGPSWRGHRCGETHYNGRCLRTGTPIRIIRGAPIILGERRQANGAAQVPVANIDVVGQEAISAQRRAIKETYEALATNAETAPVISKHLPSLGTENDVVAVQTTKLIQVLELLLKTEKLSTVQQMKIINALLSIGILTDQPDLTTLSRIKALSPEAHGVLNQLAGNEMCTLIPRHGISNIASYRYYSHPDLPNIRQFFALVYNLLDQQMGASSNLKVFTKNWLAETFANNPKAWDVFKKAFEHDFPRIKLPGTIGETLEHEPFFEAHFASCLEQILKGQEVTDSVVHKDHHKAIRNLVRSYAGALKERYTPLIEALSMIMRGHNTNLDSLEEPNKPACAEGAYLGIIKVLQEIPDVSQIIGTSLAQIDVVSCAGGVVGAAAPEVSVVSLGEVQESREQTRTFRETQDAAYEASLAADQERDRRRTEEEQNAAVEAEPEAEAPGIESPAIEETIAERRARIAAAAEARRAPQN